MENQFPALPLDPVVGVSLSRFVSGSLANNQCAVLHASDAALAPLRISVQTPAGERLGLALYGAPLARLSRRRGYVFRPGEGLSNNVADELWQDPTGLFVTLLFGFDSERGIFVGADPALHSPLSMSTPIQVSEARLAQVLTKGWDVWEREQNEDEPVEVLVGGTASAFLRYALFEREAAFEDQGHRHLLAERFAPRMQVEDRATRLAVSSRS